MADIVEFKNGKTISTENTDISNTKAIQDIAQELTKQAESIKDLSVFLIDKNKDYVIFHTESLSSVDKAYLIQMLQHDIFSELDVAEATSFEQD